VGLKMSALCIAIVGVVAIVFGIMGIMEAGKAEQRVLDEITPMGIELCNVNATYGQLSAGFAQMNESDDPEAYQKAKLNKTSLGLIRSNVGTIKFVRNTSILEIIAGAGFVLASVGLFKRD